MKPTLLSHLSSIRREMKIVAREMNLVARQIYTDCWQPDRELAYRFPIGSVKRKEAEDYLKLLDEEGYNRIFLTIHDNAYIIMRVVDAGVIHYYTEPEETQR